jgi:hypothetical protein
MTFSFKVKDREIRPFDNVESVVSHRVADGGDMEFAARVFGHNTGGAIENVDSTVIIDRGSGVE